jgi:hypothetical protein
MATGTGCVERLIHDGLGGADGGEVDLETETSVGISDTQQVSTDDTTAGIDPDAECVAPSECADDQTCFEGVCVGTGSVRVSLSWSVVTDLDLHVQTPTGEWMSYQNPITAYGELDVDDCVAGTCVNPDGVHVENVFLNENAPRGTYSVLIVNFDGRAEAGYTVEVAGEAFASFEGVLPGYEYSEGELHQFVW